MREPGEMMLLDRRLCAFSLVEIMVSLAVLLMLMVLVGQLMKSASAITRVGVKHIDADTQARAVLDRIGLDIAKMVKRTDLDCYVKQPTGYNGHGNGHGYGHKLQTGQDGNDQIAFFSVVASSTTTPSAGYYPTGYAPATQESPISLIAYRVNNDSSRPSYLMLERMTKGLLWNGVDNGGLNNATTNLPIFFLPQTIAGMDKQWHAAVNNDNTTKSRDLAYETVGPQVFRFEYWYLLKNGLLKDVPWDTDARPSQTTIDLPTGIGLTDVQAIGVAIAVIDPTSRALLSNSVLADIISDLDDFQSAPGRGVGAQKKVGDIEYRWNSVLETMAQTGQTSGPSSVPPGVAAAIRVYSRYYDLRSQ